MINIIEINMLIIIILFIIVIFKKIPKDFSMFVLIILGREHWENFRFDVCTGLYIIIGFGIGTLIAKELYRNDNERRIRNIFANFNMIALVVLEEIVWRQIAMGELKIIFDCKMQLLFIPFLSVLFLFAHRLRTLPMYIFSCFLYLSSIYFPGSNIGLHMGWNLYILNRNWNITRQE